MLARSHERDRSEKLYRQQEILLDSVADGICGLDGHGLVSFANPAASRLLGASASSLIGKPAHVLLHGSAPSSAQCGEGCTLLCAIGRPMVTSGEDTVFRNDGSSFPVDYSLTPVLDQERFLASVLSFRDISHRNALDRLKNEFISTVSHELRTPLTSIRGALGLLSMDAKSRMNEKSANLLRIALTNCDRLMTLINDTLDLDRLQSGLEPLAFQPVHLAQIVVQAIDGMRPVADAAGVQLVHDNTEAEIAANPARLLQVLTNLLSNAVKFSPRNSTISIMLCRESNGVTLSVTDDGRGIPADKLESIFDRFQQVDASDSREKGGTGLGLAICRNIVQQQSGRIWAERNPVRGSTFRVFLPYNPVSLETPHHASQKQDDHRVVLAADAGPESQPQLKQTSNLVN
jgi:PAS domain S-box-containing protein